MTAIYSVRTIAELQDVDLTSVSDGQVLTYNGSASKWENVAAYSLPTATSSILGGIKVGTGLTITSGVLSANTQVGTIYTASAPLNIDGSNNFTLNAATDSTAGSLSATDKTKLDGLSNYSLPIASGSILGGIKVSTGLAIDGSGNLTCTISPGITYTSSSPLAIDGSHNITIAASSESVTGSMSATDKVKLDSLSNYSLPTASSVTLGGIKVGSGLAIDGSGVLYSTVTPGMTYTSTAPLAIDGSHNITIAEATDSTDGILSASDKTKLDGLTNYSLPIASSSTLGGIKVGTGLAIDGSGNLTANVYSGTAPINVTGTLISMVAATDSVAGSMSASDKTKLDGITASATNTPISSSTPSTISIAATGSAGTSTSASASDHTHPTPSNYTPSTHAGTHANAGSDPISINASQITAGTVNVVRLPTCTNSVLGITRPDTTTITQSSGVLSVGSIAASSITSGTIATARLGTGTASSSTMLRGDSTYAIIPPRCIYIVAPTTLVTGADILEFPIPSDFSSRSLTRVHLRLQSTGSTSTQVKIELSTATGTFSAAQTSDTFTIPSSTNELIVTSFTSGLTASAGNKIRMNIVAVGTSAANMIIETEWSS